MVEGKSQLAQNTILVFAVGTLGIVLLGFLEDHHWITKQTEGLIRFIFGGTVTGVLLLMLLRVPLSGYFRTLIVLGCFAVQAEYLLSYTEDVPEWDDVPIIGMNSGFRRATEPILSGCWMFTALYVAFAAIRSVKTANLESQNHIRQLKESESRITRANRELSKTISELSATQQQLVEQERLRAIGEMAAGVAHDLNNALTPLVAASELLLSTIPDKTDQQLAFADLIDRSAFDVSSIVDRLGQFHMRRDASRRAAVNLRILVNQVVEGTRAKWELEPELNGVRISVDVDSDDLTVFVDPTEIRTVLTNLIFNSVQGLRSGGMIRISVTQDEEFALLAVLDTGRGMSEEELRRCMEPFFTTRSAGSGLGLAMCDRIVRSYDSALRIDSSPGEGTVVSFQLPLTEQMEPAVPTESKPRNLTRKRGLLVEDDAAVRSAIVAMLCFLGMDVESAADGASGVACVEQSDFDLIITDFAMPGLTGADVIQAIRRLRPAQQIAVLSGWKAETIEDRFFDGFRPDTVLQKPVDLDSLRELLAH